MTDYYDIFDTSRPLGAASSSLIKGRPDARILMGWRQGHWEPITPEAAREYVRAGKLREGSYEIYEGETVAFDGETVKRSYCIVR